MQYRARNSSLFSRKFAARDGGMLLVAAGARPARLAAGPLLFCWRSHMQLAPGLGITVSGRCCGSFCKVQTFSSRSSSNKAVLVTPTQHTCLQSNVYASDGIRQCPQLQLGQQRTALIGAASPRAFRRLYVITCHSSNGSSTTIVDDSRTSIAKQGQASTTGTSGSDGSSQCSQPQFAEGPQPATAQQQPARGPRPRSSSSSPRHARRVATTPSSSNSISSITAAPRAAENNGTVSTLTALPHASPGMKLQLNAAVVQQQQPLQQQLQQPGIDAFTQQISIDGAVAAAPAGIAGGISPVSRPSRPVHARPVLTQPTVAQAAQQPALQLPAAPAAAATSALPGLVPGGRLNVSVKGIVRNVTFAGEGGFKIARMEVLEGDTCSWAGPSVVAAGNATLAAAQRRGAAANNRGKLIKSSNSGFHLLCVLGCLHSIRQGSEIELVGAWQQNAQYGWQIRVEAFKELPTSDPVAYLVGCINGVGPKTAELLVKALGADSVTDVLSGPDAVVRLTAIKGIGTKKANQIKQEWDAQMSVHNAFSWLCQQGLPAATAKNVSLIFGTSAKAAAVANPYHLIDRVPGFRLQHAETLAEAVGFDPAAPERAAAVLQHVLVSASQNDAATGLPWGQLERQGLVCFRSRKMSRPWPHGLGLRRGALLLLRSGRIVIEELTQTVHFPQQQHEQQAIYQFNPVHHDNWSDNAQVMLSELHSAEEDIVNYLVEAAAACHRLLTNTNKQSLLHSNAQQAADYSTSTSSSSSSSSTRGNPLQLPPLSKQVSSWISACEKKLSQELGQPISFNEGQRAALALALQLPLLVLTGGPGCGKTLTSQAVARAWLDRSLLLAMAAPTGRAAQRLQEMVSGFSTYSASASTIHRLLGYRGYRATAAAAAREREASSSTAADADVSEGSAAGSNGSSAAAEDLALGSLCEYGKSKQLPATRLLIDEVSMMDVPLAAALLNAIDRHRTRMLVVGDPDQLPPVGPGSPLAAALAAQLLPCIDLRHIYRSAAGSAIVHAAHAINAGLEPSFTVWDLSPVNLAANLHQHLAAISIHHSTSAAATGYRLALPSNALFLRVPDSVSTEVVTEALLQAVQQLLPATGHNAQYDVQVLSPTKKGPAGTVSLNQHLQPLLNPPAYSKQEMTATPHQHHQGSGGGGVVWRVGDRVVHLLNDPERDVYNGDLGYIESVNAKERQLIVRYPPRGGSSQKPPGAAHRVLYKGGEINEQLQLAWATTVHKAQGGEFPVVLLPLHMSAGPFLLRRPLLYTAVSRAKQLLVVVGTQAALQQCIQSAAGHPGALRGLTYNDQASSSSLAHRLRAAAAARGLKPFPRWVFGPQGWITVGHQ